jgi:hypothetical protein
MSKELEILKALPINGTKETNKGNTKSSLRFGLSLESKNFKRWKKYYLFKMEEDDIIKIL